MLVIALHIWRSLKLGKDFVSMDLLIFVLVASVCGEGRLVIALHGGEKRYDRERKLLRNESRLLDEERFLRRQRI